MKILLTGATGGIGSAIREALSEHEIIPYDRNKAPKVDQYDWVVFAHGFIGEENVWQTFLANTLLTIENTQAFIPWLKYGIVYISSTAGIKGNTKFPVYSAAKAALNSYVETMSRAHPELQFYAICPGPTDTKMWRGLGLDGVAQPPSEVASAVRNCLEGAFESGDIITVRNGAVFV